MAEKKETARKKAPRRRSKAAAKSAPASPAAAPVGDLWAYADSLQVAVAETPEEEHVEEPTLWVGFGLEGRNYGLPVTDVQEVLHVGSITRVPHSPPAVRGVTNLRGRVLPVIDLRARLGLPAAETQASSRILVALHQGRPIGLLVDRVSQMVPVLPSSVKQPPEDADFRELVVGVALQEDVMVMLDTARLLSWSAAAAGGEEA